MMLSFIYDVLLASWDMLQQASIYILFGLLVRWNIGRDQIWNWPS